MRKIFMLSFANIRKTKGHTVSLVSMFLITALLLNAGLLVFIDFGGFFQKTAEELNTSDMFFIISSPLYSDKVDQYIENNSAVLKMQKENSLRAPVSIPYNGDKRECDFLLNNADTSRSLSKWKFVGEHLAPDSMSIYVPYILNVDGGYKLNDKLNVTFKDKVITFTIKGFVDDVMFSALDIGSVGVYLPQQTFDNVKQILGSQYDVMVVFTNLSKKNSNIEAGIKDIMKQEKSISAADADSAVVSINLPTIKMARTVMASMVSAMMVAFAAVIACVCLLVIRFRIANSIEEDMLKIGSLKAMGYTSRQIISSIVLQFSEIALVGSTAGILLSYLTTPLLSDVFAHQSGLMWQQGFDGVISSATLILITFVVVFISLIAARRIHKLNPIVALRGGIVTHSFKKNYMPLHKSRGSLPIVFALKSILQNKRASFMIMVILIFVAFASAFSVIMFYNSAVDTTNFAKTPGIEISNAAVILNPEVDNIELVKDIKNMNGVRKAQYIDKATVVVQNTNANATIMDDYSKKETDTVYEGRYPRHSNEVAIAGVLTDIIGKGIGDTVILRIGDKQADFIITGFTQGANFGGVNVFVTREGMLKLNPNFKQQDLEIYLNKGVSSAEFITELNSQYGKSLLEIQDVDKGVQQGMGAYTSIISKVGAVTFAINILVVILVLYFVINSSIVRRKHELGIQKAIGFTTLQLMNQISIGFLPPIIIGVIIGSILGITQTNAIMSVAQRSMCIMKAGYIITPGWISLFGVAIVIISYLTSMLITYRIRKISAYALVNE